MSTFIILPFKNTNGKYLKALDEFIEPFTSYLNSTNIDYEIILVEQLGGGSNTTLPSYYSHLIKDNDEFFNLGRTINIGYDILKDKMLDDDIFIFHPVDLLPINVNYSIDKTTKFCYDVHSPTGVFYKSIGFKVSDFKKTNGFSNKYWGWGLEDDDLMTRLEINNITIDTKIDSYLRLNDDGNGFLNEEHYMPLYNYNTQFLNEIRVGKNCTISGISDLNYKLLEKTTYKSIKKYIIE